MQFGCTGCNVKSSHGSADQEERPAKPKTVVGIVEPSRRPAGMRKWNKHALAVDPDLSHDIAERNASPETFDRKRSDEEDHARSHERELRIEPWRAKRDLGRRGSTIPRSAQCFAGKALRDGRAVRQMRFVDACVGEPASELSAGTPRERQTRRELDRARSLTDDHHAIARLAVDDGKCRRQVARFDTLRARADA